MIFTLLKSISFIYPSALIRTSQLLKTLFSTSFSNREKDFKKSNLIMSIFLLSFTKSKKILFPYYNEQEFYNSL